MDAISRKLKDEQKGQYYNTTRVTRRIRIVKFVQTPNHVTLLIWFNQVKSHVCLFPLPSPRDYARMHAEQLLHYTGPSV